MENTAEEDWEEYTVESYVPFSISLKQLWSAFKRRIKKFTLGLVHIIDSFKLGARKSAPGDSSNRNFIIHSFMFFKNLQNHTSLLVYDLRHEEHFALKVFSDAAYETELIVDYYREYEVMSFDSSHEFIFFLQAAVVRTKTDPKEPPKIVLKKDLASQQAPPITTLLLHADCKRRKAFVLAKLDFELSPNYFWVPNDTRRLHFARYSEQRMTFYRLVGGGDIKELACCEYRQQHFCTSVLGFAQDKNLVYLNVNNQVLGYNTGVYCVEQFDLEKKQKMRQYEYRSFKTTKINSKMMLLRGSVLICAAEEGRQGYSAIHHLSRELVPKFVYRAPEKAYFDNASITSYRGRLPILSFFQDTNEPENKYKTVEFCTVVNSELIFHEIQIETRRISSFKGVDLEPGLKVPQVCDISMNEKGQLQAAILNCFGDRNINVVLKSRF